MCGKRKKQGIYRRPPLTGFTAPMVVELLLYTSDDPASPTGQIEVDSGVTSSEILGPSIGRFLGGFCLVYKIGRAHV